MTWAAVIALAGGTFALKAVGPVLAGGRRLRPWLLRVTGLLPPALLAALVAVQTVAGPDGVVLDARLAGLGGAAVAVAARAPFALVVACAMGVAALVRALG